MTTTTLITFMVRCPPTTRSVSLMGSWDNFKMPYAMQRDSRIGPEHWSGCHTFSNIICDGKKLSDSQPRDGALKMGGTYWYYYKLDDDIEFHNSVEPSTTQCPLLPGQLINELHVPLVLSGNRSRNPSVSSTSSERRTMNPSDKYVNPRPVPKPKLSRLKTSPQLGQAGWSSTSTPASSHSGRLGTSATAASEPGSADTIRILRAAKKPSVDGLSRSSSRTNSPASALSQGLRSAFRSFRSPRSASPDTAIGDESIPFDRYFDRANRNMTEGYDVRQPRSLGSSRDPSPNTRSRQGTIDHDLVFRKLTASADGSIESVAPASFQKHRRQRSTSREPSSLRNSLSLEDGDTPVLREIGYPSRQPLSTLKEVASAQNTPGILTAGLRTADLEKRLPTLPNSPSSAYPASATGEGSSNRGSLDMDNLQSHFSTTTIDTSTSTQSSPGESSTHFSGWSQCLPTARSSTYATSLIDEEPMSALLTEEVMTPRRKRSSHCEEDTEFEETPSQTYPRRDESLPTFLSSSTVSSTTVSSLSTSPSDYTPSEDNWPEMIDRQSPESFYYQRYRLPADDHGSKVTLKESSPQDIVPSGPPAAQAFGLSKDQNYGNGRSAYPHSNNMQHLLDELSYLGEAIHQS